jgi:hypothetical protein
MTVLLLEKNPLLFKNNVSILPILGQAKKNMFMLGFRMHNKSYITILYQGIIYEGIDSIRSHIDLPIDPPQMIS